MGVWGLAPRNVVRATPSRTSENDLLEHDMKAAITIDIYSQSKNYSLTLKCKEVTVTLAFAVG